VAFFAALFRAAQRFRCAAAIRALASGLSLRFARERFARDAEPSLKSCFARCRRAISASMTDRMFLAFNMCTPEIRIAKVNNEFMLSVSQNGLFMLLQIGGIEMDVAKPLLSLIVFNSTESGAFSTVPNM
jgi:hypothetical protein